jgi:hypothetical protein
LPAAASDPVSARHEEVRDDLTPEMHTLGMRRIDEDNQYIITVDENGRMVNQDLPGSCSLIAPRASRPSGSPTDHIQSWLNFEPRASGVLLFGLPHLEMKTPRSRGAWIMLALSCATTSPCTAHGRRA